MLSTRFIPFPGLATERLSLRQLVAGDEAEIFKLRSDARVNQFLTRNQCKNLEEAAGFIKKISTIVTNGDGIYWAISMKNDNKLIGTICFWNFQREDYRTDIGYELNPDFWGKGIMKEVIPKVVNYAFTTMKLHSIQADLHPENIRSISVLEKSGFIKEGHFKESIYFNGKFLDRVVYSLLNT